MWLPRVMIGMTYSSMDDLASSADTTLPAFLLGLDRGVWPVLPVSVEYPSAVSRSDSPSTSSSSSSSLDRSALIKPDRDWVVKEVCGGSSRSIGLGVFRLGVAVSRVCVGVPGSFFTLTVCFLGVPKPRASSTASVSLFCPFSALLLAFAPLLLVAFFLFLPRPSFSPASLSPVSLRPVELRVADPFPDPVAFPPFFTRPAFPFFPDCSETAGPLDLGKRITSNSSELVDNLGLDAPVALVPWLTRET